MINIFDLLDFPLSFDEFRVRHIEVFNGNDCSKDEFHFAIKVWNMLLDRISYDEAEGRLLLSIGFETYLDVLDVAQARELALLEGDVLKWFKRKMQIVNLFILWPQLRYMFGRENMRRAVTLPEPVFVKSCPPAVKVRRARQPKVKCELTSEYDGRWPDSSGCGKYDMERYRDHSGFPGWQDTNFVTIGEGCYRRSAVYYG